MASSVHIVGVLPFMSNVVIPQQLVLKQVLYTLVNCGKHTTKPSKFPNQVLATNVLAPGYLYAKFFSIFLQISLKISLSHWTSQPAMTVP